MNEVVPFGKYRGQPIEVLASDPAYLDWLLAQDWVKARYQNIYNVIINNFQALSETPEHNILQGRFLDTNYIIDFLRVSFPKIFDLEMPVISNVKMEAYGMDVVFRVAYKYIWHLTQEKYDREGGSDWWGQTKPGDNIDTNSFYVGIEIKPSLGDDYPAVLRQIKNSVDFKQPSWKREIEYYFLYVGSYVGSITEEQLIAFFALDHIRVVFRSDVEA